MVTVLIGGKSFVVPDEVSYRQYRHIVKLFQSLKVDFEKIMEAKNSAKNMDTAFQVSDVLQALIEQDKLPELFATLLVPESDISQGKAWRETNIDEYKLLMEDLGDKTFSEVVKDFLSGRTDLILSFMVYLGKFMNENNLSLPNSTDSEKEQEVLS